MANRKYERYEVAAGDDSHCGYEDFDSYRDAFAMYQHFKNIGAEHVTLWGINDMGEYTCIMSF